MIREATNKDIEIINEMFKNNFNMPITKDVFAHIAVFEQEKILGFIDYSVMYERAELNYIAVLEDYKRKHIASNLMEYMLKNLEDIENISLEVNVNNEVAIKLYKKYGFEVVATRKNYYQNDDAYLMIRKK